VGPEIILAPSVSMTDAYFTRSSMNADPADVPGTSLTPTHVTITYPTVHSSSTFVLPTLNLSTQS